MKDFSIIVTKQLNSILDNMEQNKSKFLIDPDKNFSRIRKLAFRDTIKLILSMEDFTLTKEISEYFSYASDCISKSGFTQQRAKILPSAFQYLFHKFTQSAESIRKPKTYQGYRLLAVDGSDLIVPTNANEESTFNRPVSYQRGYNSYHLNALFDLNNQLYEDAILQPRSKCNEYDAAIQMIHNSKISQPVIFIADRGYESYNLLAHLEQKSWNYLIRVKDVISLGKGIVSTLALPKEGEFDVTINLDLSKSNTKEIRDKYPNYKQIGSSSRFDFFENKKSVYTMNLRIVRIKITDSTYETVLTNLEKDKFPMNSLKKLYSMRWGIETSFRQLKYSVKLSGYHSKLATSIEQEVFARLIMYNFCQVITVQIILERKKTKYVYKVNFAVAIEICKYAISLRSRLLPPNIEAVIRRHIIPIRDDRHFIRKIKEQTANSFLYR